MEIVTTGSKAVQAVDGILSSVTAFLMRNYVGALGFCVSWLAVCNNYALLRGRTPDNLAAHLVVRSILFSLLWMPINIFVGPTYGKLLLLYAPVYLDLTEHYGWPWIRRVYTQLFYPLRLRKWLTKAFRADVIRADSSTTSGSAASETQPNNKQCVFGVHPHGVLPVGSILNMSSVSFSPSKMDTMYTHPKRVILAATSCFLVPGWRELLMSLNVYDCSRANAQRWLKDGYSVCIVPGGAREGLYSSPEVDWLDLKRKRGFIRLALQFGCNLVPTYTFNEVHFVSQVNYHSVNPSSFVGMFRSAFQKTFGISFPLITGLTLVNKYDDNQFPRFVTVIGDAIDCPTIKNPSDDVVDVYMAKYCMALERIYSKYGPEYNSKKDRQLLIT
jgi:hypothetical protein